MRYIQTLKARTSLVSIGLLTLVITLLPLGVVSAATSSSSVTPPLALSWNYNFQFPDNIATDSKGNVYVADNYAGQIEEFNSSGNIVAYFGYLANDPVNDPTGLYSPHGLAVDASGDLYIADGGNNRIVELSPQGDFVNQWSVNDPWDVALSGGYIYALDSIDGLVEKISPSDGSVVGSYDGSNSGESFDNPSSLAVNSAGDLYVADTTNSRVVELSSSGTYIAQWDGSSSGTQFSYPNGVAVDPSNGDVLVTDNGNARVAEFSGNGSYITQWNNGGGFSTIFGIAADDSNNVYVLDAGNDAIDKFSYPQNLASETAPGTSDQVNVTLPAGSNITNESIASATAPDGSYSLPFGLFSFTFSTADGNSGDTVPIQLTFQTSLTPSQVIAVKYNATTQRYGNIPGATITETTVDGKPALKLTYSITDGGSLDQDGTANGIIVDPVGLASTATLPTNELASSSDSGNSAKTPDTGYGEPAQSNTSPLTSSALVSGAILSIGAGLTLLYRQKNLLRTH